jgi:hypothetical protein
MIVGHSISYKGELIICTIPMLQPASVTNFDILKIHELTKLVGHLRNFAQGYLTTSTSAEAALHQHRVTTASGFLCRLFAVCITPAAA